MAETTSLGGDSHANTGCYRNFDHFLPGGVLSNAVRTRKSSCLSSDNTLPLTGQTNSSARNTSVSAINLVDLSPMSRSNQSQLLDTVNTRDRHQSDNLTSASYPTNSVPEECHQRTSDMVPFLLEQKIKSLCSTQSSDLNTKSTLSTNSSNCILLNNKQSVIHSHPLVSEIKYDIFALFVILHLLLMYTTLYNCTSR